MNNFDPDKYLSEFDPDAYLKEDEAIETAPETSSTAQDILTAAQEGVSLGMAPRISGAAAFLGTLSGGQDLEAAKAAYEEGKALQKAEQEAAAKRSPVAYDIARVAGGLAVPGSKVKALLTQGAIAGASQAEDLISMEALKQAGMGAGLAGAGIGAGKVIGDVAGVASSKAQVLADYLKRKAGTFAEDAAGLTRTLGQRAELEKQLAKGKISEGEIGERLLEQGIVTKGASSKTIAERAMAARQAAGKEIEKAVSEVPDQDPMAIRDKLLKRAGELKSSGDQGELKNELLRIADTYGSEAQIGPRQFLTGQEIQASKIKSGQKGFQEGSESQAILNRELDKLLKERMTPEQAARYAEANLQSSMLIPASEAAAKQSAADMVKKTLTVGAAPAIGIGYGAFQGDPLAGLAAGAAFRLGQKRGSQFVAGTMYDVGKLIEKAPERLKPVLQRAAERGSSSVAATHFLLQQQDPEYNKAINEED